MASIINFLCQDDDNSAGRFTVNTSGVVSVPILAGLGGDELYDYSGNSFFVAGESFTILSYGFALPLGFELYPRGVGAFTYGRMAWRYKERGAGGANSLLPYAGQPLVWGQYEYAHGGYIDEVSLTDDFELWPQLIDVEVSMFNVDAALDGLVFKVPIFMKIEHNVPLIV